MAVGSISIFVLFFCHVLLFFSLFPAMQILRLGSLNVNGLRDCAAILFSAHLDVNILSQIETEKGRIMMVKAEVKNQLFVFINIYAPNKGSDRSDMLRKLEEFLKSNVLDGVLIIGGDWNCTLNFLLDRNNEEPHPVSASLLKSITIQNDLVYIWRDRNKDMKQFTRTKVSQGRISVARLDRFYVKTSAENNRVMGCNIFPCFHQITILLQSILL